VKNHDEIGGDESQRCEIGKVGDISVHEIVHSGKETDLTGPAKARMPREITELRSPAYFAALSLFRHSCLLFGKFSKN
jgi:hypothetical protein